MNFLTDHAAPGVQYLNGGTLQEQEIIRPSKYLKFGLRFKLHDNEDR